MVHATSSSSRTCKWNTYVQVSESLFICNYCMYLTCKPLHVTKSPLWIISCKLQLSIQAVHASGILKFRSHFLHVTAMACNHCIQIKRPL